MATKRFIKNRQRNSKTRKVGDKKSKSGKKWITAIEAAQKTLSKTKSLRAAQSSLRKQALYNARKLFGSI